jgi:sporulation protein YlmC with PRC-barrel domain
MDIPLNVDVHCSDGRCGRSTHIIVNPATEQVTHLVVKEQWPSKTERIVPVDWLVTTTRDIIVLKHNREQFTQLDPFNQTDFIQRDVPHYASDPKLTLVWPYTVPAQKIVEDTHRMIPPDELAVRRGAKVRATDGRIGQVDEFLIDPASGYISHLILREGLPWDKKHVAIPITDIERIEENTVYLKQDKKSVKALPSIPLRPRK